MRMLLRLLRRLLRLLVMVVVCSGGFAVLQQAAPASAAGAKVLLRDVSQLVLRRGEYTEGRRAAAVPQITCVGGTARNAFQPDTIVCRNTGWDGQDVVWQCDAQLPLQYKLGRTTVSCEGYNYPDDKYILAGSCGVEYTIDYTSKGRRSALQSDYYGDQPASWIGWIIQWGVILLFCFFMYLCCCSGSERRSGGGGGGYNAPGDPPPYSASYDYARADPSCSSFQAASSYPSASSGPGFFSGMGLGGALGYMLARSREPSSGSMSSAGYPRPSYGFGSGGSAAATSPTSTTYTSTSHATTRRR